MASIKGPLPRIPAGQLREQAEIAQPKQADVAKKTKQTQKAKKTKATSDASRFERIDGGKQRPAKTTALPAAKLERPLEDLVKQLDVAARRETARHALTCVAKYDGPLAKKARALLKDKSFMAGDFPAGREALSTQLAHALAGSDRGKAAEAVRILEDELTIFRGGERRDLIFSVEHVTLPANLPAPRHLESTPGFSPGVDGIDLKAPHSMHDVQGYVRERLGDFFIDDLIRNERPIEVHEGSVPHAMASLKARGFDAVFRLRGPKSDAYNQVFLAHNSKSGEARYCMAEISGQDRLAHMQKLLRLAEVRTDGGVKRVEPARVEVFSDRLLDDQDIYRRYSRSLLASGTVPANAIIGFKNGLMRELGGRAAAARQLEHVQQTLGPDPVATLRARAADAGANGKALSQALDALGDKAGVLAMEPSRLFRFEANVTTLREVETVLATVAAKNPASAVLFDDVVGEAGFKVTVRGHVAERVNGDDFIDQSVVTYLDRDGDQRSLLLSRNPYGDLAHQMGRVLVDNKVENVLVVGTVGDVSKDGKLGDVHAPGKVFGADGKALPFANSTLQVIASKERAKELPGHIITGSTLAEVDSPLDETLDQIKAMQARGYDIVEMELADLLRATQGSDTKVGGMYIVSDLPGTKNTLESHTGGHLGDSLGDVADVLIEQLGIRDVTLVGDARPEPVTGFAGAVQLATRMLDARGVSGPDHLLLRYTLARYLMNGLSDKAIGSLAADSKSDPLQTPQLASRWRAKIERELKAPFTNDQVVKHLRWLGGEMGKAVQEIEKLGGKPDNYKLYVLGSIIKGRAGVGSDVDALIRTEDRAMANKLFDSPYGYAGAPEDSLVVLGCYDYATKRGSHYGPLVDIGSGRQLLKDDGLMVELYAKALAPYGVEVKRGDDGKYQVRDAGFGSGKATNPERETEAVAERVLEYEKAYRKFMNSDFVIKHVQDTAPLADVVHLPFARLKASGDALLHTRLAKSINKDNVLHYLQGTEARSLLQSARGQAFLQSAKLADGDALIARIDQQGLAGLPLEKLIDGSMAAELMGLDDPLDRLAVDLSAAERAREANTTGESIDDNFAFFAGETKQALQREAGGGAPLNPLFTQLAAAKRNKPTIKAKRLKQTAKVAPDEIKLPEFYDRHLSRNTAAKVGVTQVKPGPDGVGRVDVAALTKNDPISRILIETARDHNVTVGFWGGTARDFMTQRDRDVTSDFDLMYNSAEPGLDAFKKELIGRYKAHFGEKIPWVDFSVDMNPDKKMRGPYRGLSVEKIGVLGDGRVFDFTGRGLTDMQTGVLHYNAPTPDEGPGISSVFRMTGAQLQNPSAEFDAETHAMMRRVLDEFYAPGTPGHKDLKAFYKATKDLGRREVKKYVKTERAAHGGKAPGENLLDFMKTLKYIVDGGVATDPKRYLDTLSHVGITGFLESLGAGAKLDPLRSAAGEP